MTPQAQLIQGLLFVAGEAVEKEELAKLLHEPLEAVDRYLVEVSQALAGQGIAIIVAQETAQITTSPAIAGHLAQYQKEDLGSLSKAAAETLAIIAYRGPLSRYDIDVLRGVDSRSMVRQLVRRGIVRQSKGSGRTPRYDITEDFLLHIGVTKREDLPEFAVLSNSDTIERVLKEQEL